MAHGKSSDTAAPASQHVRGGVTRLLDGLEWVSRIGSWISGGFMLLIVALILVEIAVRTGWDSSTQIASEYSGYFMVAMVLLGFAETFRSGAFIRIQLLMPRLPKAAQRLTEIAMALISLGITLYALRYSLDMAWESFRLDMRADTMAETPFWMPQAAVPLGLALLALQLAIFIVRRLGRAEPS